MIQVRLEFSPRYEGTQQTGSTVSSLFVKWLNEE